MDRDLAIISLGRLLQIALALVTVKAFTALLSAAEVGNLYLINSLLGFFTLALISPVGLYLNRQTHRWAEEATLYSNLLIFRLYVVALALFSTGLMYVLFPYLYAGSDLHRGPFIILVMVTIYILTWNQTLIPTLNLLHHRISFVFFTVLTLSIGLGLSVVSVHYGPSTAVSWLYGQAAAMAIVTFFASFYFKRATRQRADLRHILQALSVQNGKVVASFAAPLGVTTLFMWLQYQSYRIVVEKTLGLEFLGMLGLGLTIASNVAAVAESLVHQLFFPVFYRDINTADQRQRAHAWNSMAQSAVPLYVSLTIMATCLAPQLVTVLANDTFARAAQFIVFGAWIELFRMITNTLTTVAHSEMRTRHLLRAYLLGGLLAFAGTLGAVRLPHAEQTVPAALLLSGLITLAVMYYDMKKLMQISLGARRIWQSVLLSLPYGVVLLLPRERITFTFASSVILASGTYFLVSQYFLFKRLPEGTYAA